MDPRLDANKVVLLEDDLFVIRAERRVVWCQVITPPQVDPTRGAAAARAIETYLLGSVLERRSGWLGLVLDVRQGPTVVGPVTLGVLERLFARAEQVRKPLAALSRSDSAQTQQFRGVQSVHAPRYAIVTSDPAAAVDWMTNAAR